MIFVFCTFCLSQTPSIEDNRSISRYEYHTNSVQKMTLSQGYWGLFIDSDVKSQPREEKRYFKIKIPHTNFSFVFVFVIVILFVFVFVICICLYLSFWRKTVHQSRNAWSWVLFSRRNLVGHLKKRNSGGHLKKTRCHLKKQGDSALVDDGSYFLL